MPCPSPISYASDSDSVRTRYLTCLLVVLLATSTGANAQHGALHVYPFTHDGGIGVMDQDGSIMADPVFDAAGRGSGGVIPLRSGTRWGLWSATDSTWSIDPEYDALVVATDSVLAARTGDGWRPLTHSGRPLGPGLFHEIREPSGGIFPAAVAEDQGPIDERIRWGVFSLGGDTLVAPEFENVLAFSDGLAPARISRRLLRFIKRSPRWGFISPDGAWMIQPEFDSARSFSDGLALVSDGGELFFVDVRGVRRITVRHDLAYSFSEGRARIVDQGLWGWLDTDGNTVIEPAWDGALDFSEGFAAVRRAGRWGYVDSEGRIAIPLEFDAAAPFRGPLAEVSVGGRRFRIDRTGREVAPRLTGAAR